MCLKWVNGALFYQWNQFLIQLLGISVAKRTILLENLHTPLSSKLMVNHSYLFILLAFPLIIFLNYPLSLLLDFYYFMPLIVLLVPPRVTPFYFEDNPLHEMAYAQINCLVAEGDLPILISWKLNGHYIDNYAEIAVSKVGKRSSILTIESVSYFISGNYTCEAKNAAGESSYTTELQVNGYYIQNYFIFLLFTSHFLP